MTRPANERSVERYWRVVWTEGRTAAAGEFYAPSFRLNGRETSPERFAEGADGWLAHFSDFRADVVLLFSCGGRVVSRVIYRATHSGDLGTVPATGRSFEVSGIDIFEFEEGRVVGHWHETDHWQMYEQLGVEARLAEEPRA